MNSRLIIGAVIVVSVLLLVAAAVIYQIVDTTYIEGYWVVIPEYASSAGINSQMLFIGPAKDNSRPAHIVIDEYVDEPFEIICTPLRRNIFYEGPVELKTTCAFECADAPIPKNVTLEFSMADGTLRIYDDEKIYGAFYKDHEVSAMYAL